MRTIFLQGKLGDGRKALVDDEDYDRINEYRWNYSSGYAYSVEKVNGLSIKMHRMVMGLTDPSKIIDHINMNKLDNRRDNLRIVNAGQNALRRSLSKKNTSGYRGVNYRKDIGLWNASIKYKGKQISLGCYPEKEHAVVAYDVAARILFGRFAMPNKDWLEKEEK